MPGRRSKGGPRPPERTSPRPARGRQTAKISEIGDAIAAAKARRSIKLREVEVALRRAGLIALDEQARALGLSRTTTWKILRGNRRSYEPSAATINRILCAPRLPFAVRIKILEYVQERVSGMYYMGTTNLNCVDFLSASDGIVPANHEAYA
jgi:hypothetical protein